MPTTPAFSAGDSGELTLRLAIVLSSIAEGITALSGSNAPSRSVMADRLSSPPFVVAAAENVDADNEVAADGVAASVEEGTS